MNKRYLKAKFHSFFLHHTIQGPLKFFFFGLKISFLGQEKRKCFRSMFRRGFYVNSTSLTRLNYKRKLGREKLYFHCQYNTGEVNNEINRFSQLPQGTQTFPTKQKTKKNQERYEQKLQAVNEAHRFNIVCSFS